MATTTAQIASIRPEPATMAELNSFEMKSSEPVQAIEDDSSLSSTGTDIFDHDEPASSSLKEVWRLNNGEWQRYGSLESAASTGITSMCSSNSAEESQPDHSVVLTPSKKRMLNGTFKLRTASPSTKPSTPANTSTSDETSIEPLTKLTERSTKRRGRPPKSFTASASDKSKVRSASTISKLQGVVRPRSSIPTTISASAFANQCIEAAISSRLDPYSLHHDEHELLVDSITTAEVTVYLNIRNAILRLWIRNSRCSITPEEAAGCAKEGRFFGLAEVAYKWLIRNGYINFGCVEICRDTGTATRGVKFTKQKTVAVIGAGVSGLTTARQLEHLFAHTQEYWSEVGERPPRVIVLEGRKRVGGRVYSKPLRSQVVGSLPGDLRNTAEMGAMIVTGFERGNPLDTIIRGQLGLRYHLLTDALTIYDCDGKPVDEEKDMLNTDLYTDISDRTGEFRATAARRETLKGDEELISRCRDPVPNGLTTFQVEPLAEYFDSLKQRKPISKRGRRRNAPPGTEKLTGRSQVVEGGSAAVRAARAAHQMGWQVKEGVSKNHTVSLRAIAEAHNHPSLGTVMDAAILQYQGLLEFSPLDMRLLNWHHANLEYANAAPVTWLSLSGHDQDNGNEFEGAHSEIVGGYTQVPRGLMNLPTKLDVRFDRVVESIHYDGGYEEDDPKDNDRPTTKIVCTDGEVIEADEVVVTAPLGVLKSNMIDFDPPLPSWKQGAIERMGFGLLNKVILLYDEPFWDETRDMIGLLNEAEEEDSLQPEHYEGKRGRFYLIWNASKISGRPMLVALMAGHAAYQAESTDTPILLDEVTERLRKVFKAVPAPREVIVTRWRSDPFSRGTYSYVAPKTRTGDYDLMAKPVGNLHFAGEATCGSHPATVHGALLSGLRVASDVVDAMAGPISLPVPLVGPPEMKQEAATAMSAKVFHTAIAPTGLQRGSIEAVHPQIKLEDDSSLLPKALWTTLDQRNGPPSKSVCSRDPSFWAMPSFENNVKSQEGAIADLTFSQIGERPIKPPRSGVNPFLLYTKAKWEECKSHCSGSADQTAGRNLIRQTLGHWWKGLAEDEKQPYLDQSKAAQDLADAERQAWEQKVTRWDENSKRIRQDYIRDNPRPIVGSEPSSASAIDGWSTVASKRTTNVSTNVALDVKGP